MSWLRISAVARRHAYVLMRSPHRWFDVLIWPLVDCLLFGSIGVFISRQGGTGTRPTRSPISWPASCCST